MRIALYILVGLVVLVLIVVLIGYMLPKAHVASRTRSFNAPPDTVFALISTPADYPKWRPTVKSVEILAPEGGKARFREVSSDGTILFQVDESQPNRRLVTRIADPSLPFGGRWVFELTAGTGGGTTLTIT